MSDMATTYEYVTDGRGREFWLHDGKLHRENGPAVVTKNSEEWWLNGRLHRADGPAVLKKNGLIEEWWFDGLRHRTDGPAYTIVTGGGTRMEAYEFGRKANLLTWPSYGPERWYAIVTDASGSVPILESVDEQTGEVKERLSLRTDGTVAARQASLGGSDGAIYVHWVVDAETGDYTVVKIETPIGDADPEMWDALQRLSVRVNDDGSQEWLNENGERHRLDGPAYVADGVSIWYQNGKKHRLDGPALIDHDKEAWYQEDQLHRIDGPAIVFASGDESWYRRNVLHRIGGPAIVRADGYQAWYVKGRFHNADGPAIVRPDGSEEWYLFGKRHRVDGPASVNGTTQQWWYQGALHREGGPAETAMADENIWVKRWYVNGRLHRPVDEGPAVEFSNGAAEWWVEGERVEAPTDKTPVKEWWQEEGAIWL